MKLLILLSFTGAALAQPTQFEVASVKPFVQPSPQEAPAVRKTAGRRGGPGSSDPGQITWGAATLKALLMHAYSVKAYQVSGPEWMGTERYSIAAKVPPDASPEQVLVMWQNLLAERFHLKLHRETKDIPVYELTVARNGPKMKESPPEVKVADSPGSPPARPPMGPDGCPMFAPGRGGSMMTVRQGRYLLCAAQMTIESLVSGLTAQVDRPIFDKTGLTARYDLRLEFAPEGTLDTAADPNLEPAPPIAAAFQAQLGLKLEAKKAPAEILVIDRVERTPTEN